LLRAVLGNLALILLVAGGLMLASSGLDFSLVRGGRLTEFACWLFLAAIGVAAVWLIRYDRRASRGDVDTSRMPFWLRDTNDPSIWMKRDRADDEV
jgi:hypothetical protein